jgi:hypothetical protein
VSDDDLVTAHDAIASLSRSYSTADDYRAELARREVNGQTRTMLRLTWVIAALTLANADFVAYSVLHYADLIACVDGLSARKKMLAEQIGEPATDPAWWPTVARLRAFRGVDTLTALAIHLELGADWQRFEKPTRVGSWLGLTPIAPAVRRE